MTTSRTNNIPLDAGSKLRRPGTVAKCRCQTTWRGRRGIGLHLNIDDRLGQIQADERKVRQIVLNLLSNAIKFTPEGGRIDVGAAPKDGLVEVSVSDTKATPITYPMETC